MKITLTVANQQTLEFASLKDLAKHYSTLADAWRSSANATDETTEGQKSRMYNLGKADAYDIICWQLHLMKIES